MQVFLCHQVREALQQSGADDLPVAGEAPAQMDRLDGQAGDTCMRDRQGSMDRIRPGTSVRFLHVPPKRTGKNLY